jgi:glycosyltransferase involved in cell wall biosynthesis
VVPPQDSRALSAALEKLLENEALGSRLGEQARMHCRERFSLDTMLDRMETIYRQVSGQMLFIKPRRKI